MDLGLHLVGEAGRRGLIPRTPTAERLLEDIQAWLTTDAGRALRSIRSARTADDRPGLLVELHPAAEPLEIAVGEAARVTAVAATSRVGPGYHTFVAQMLKRLGTELVIAWEPTDQAAGTGDPTGYFDSGDRADAERALLVWLRSLLEAGRRARASGASAVHLGLPIVTRFEVDDPVVTVLGPRDDAWLVEACDNPRRAVEFWPWWADATDARHYLNRALCLMWTQVRWRSPATDEEVALFDEVLGLLRHAFPLDSSLAYPWREWNEIQGLRGLVRDSMADRIAERAAGAEGPLIGYRRHSVRAYHEGWSVPLPGSFSERHTGEELLAREAGRDVTLAATITGTEDGGPMRAEAFLERVASHLGPDAFEHRAGPIVGRARMSVDDSSGVEVAVVEGYSAVPGSGAAIRIVIDDPSDWEWALDTWRGLEHD